MSTLHTILVLRKQPLSFWQGAASAFDYSPFVSAYNISPTPQSADAHAIASDFIVTGNDMRAALTEYGATR